MCAVCHLPRRGQRYQGSPMDVMQGTLMSMRYQDFCFQTVYIWYMYSRVVFTFSLYPANFINDQTQEIAKNLSVKQLQAVFLGIKSHFGLCSYCEPQSVM